MNTILTLQKDDSTSFESRITHYLMKDCYHRLIEELGKVKAELRMNEAWILIEKEMAESGISEPVSAASILFEKSNYNQQLRTLYYAAIFLKESRYESSKEK